MFLLDCIWKASLILALAVLAAVPLRRAAASTRHLVWIAALGGVLLLPAASRVAPLRMVSVPAPAAALFRVEAMAAPAVRGPAVRGREVSAPAVPARRIPWLGMWLAGALLVMLRAVWRPHRLGTRAARPEATQLARRLAEDLGIRRPVRVIEAGAASMPVTWGLFRPVIVLPAGVPEERLRVILLHELAHIARHDYAMHLVGQAACALYWFHPLVWLCQARALRLRERAADDLVLRSGVRASDYAAHLLGMARSLRASRLCGSLAAARRSSLEERVRAILDSGLRRGTARPAGVLAAGVLACACALTLAPVRPAAAQSDIDAQAAAASSAYDFEQARDLYTRAAEVRRSQHGEMSIQYGQALATLGALYQAWDLFPEASAAYTRSAAILEQVSPGDPLLFDALYFQAMNALVAKDSRAAEHYQRALDFARTEKLPGAKTALALNGLASLAAQAGNTALSAQYLEEAQAASNEDSPETATILQNWAAALRKLGRVNEADAAGQRASDVRARLKAAPLPPRAPTSAYRAGNGVSAPRLAAKKEPEYSQEARINKIQGTVVLQVEVGTDGVAHNIRVLRPMGFGIDQKAVDAIRRWRFEPGIKDGQPVNVQATIEVNFRLL